MKIKISFFIFALLVIFVIGASIWSAQNAPSFNPESVTNIENARELASNEIESLTGKSVSDFVIQEIPLDDDFGKRVFLFSHKGDERLLEGNAIGVLVELKSGKVTVLMD